MMQVLNYFALVTQSLKQRSEHVSNSKISFIRMYGQYFGVGVHVHCPLFGGIGQTDGQTEYLGLYQYRASVAYADAQ